MQTLEVRAAVIKRIFESKCFLTEDGKVQPQMIELILAILTEDEHCVTLLNAIFAYPNLFNKERVELAEHVNQLIKALVPGFTHQINLDQLPNALFLLLSRVSGMPEQFLIEFVQRLRQADMNDEGHPYPGRALGSLYRINVETEAAIRSYWDRQAYANP